MKILRFYGLNFKNIKMSLTQSKQQFLIIKWHSIKQTEDKTHVKMDDTQTTDAVLRCSY